jgi:hypothetical protein
MCVHGKQVDDGDNICAWRASGASVSKANSNSDEMLLVSRR